VFFNAVIGSIGAFFALLSGFVQIN